MAKKTILFIIGYFLYVPGVFVALIGGVYIADRYVDTASNPVPGWVMIVLLAVVIGAPAVVFSVTWNRPNRWQRALQKDGRQALARIVDVADTGVSSGGGLTIYVRLTLDVRPDGEAPFPAKIELANSRVAIMHPGATIPVRYDPLNRKHVAFDDNPASEPEIGSPWEQEPSHGEGRSPQTPANAMHVLHGLIGSGVNQRVYVMDRSDGSLNASAPGAAGTDLPAQLAQLDSFHRSGALTDAEYSAAKAKLLE